MAIRTRLGAIRYNNRMAKIWEAAKGTVLRDGTRIGYPDDKPNPERAAAAGWKQEASHVKA